MNRSQIRSRLRAILRGENSQSPTPAVEPEPAPGTPERWFLDHYDFAPGEIIDFLAADGISLEGKVVADIGSGDGIIDLGVMHRARPTRLVGFDLRRTDEQNLLKQARDEGVADGLPDGLEFMESQPVTIPAPDASFDAVITWSAFEHIADPVSLAREIRRILKPDGTLFLQLWPFYHSERGSHLWDWFPEPFHHLVQHEDEIRDGMRPLPGRPEGWSDYMLDEFRHLNQVTADELQRALLAGGLLIGRVELLTAPTHIRPELSRYPITTLAISGIKLLATRLS
jgi:SAM-dependent methyltransferase